MSELPDLPSIIDDCREKVRAVDTTLSVSVRDDVWQEIINQFSSNSVTSVIDGKILVVENTNSQRLFITAQELPVAMAVVPYLKALSIYNDALNKLSDVLGFDSRTSGAGKLTFSGLPSRFWKDGIKGNPNGLDPITAVDGMFDDPQDAGRMKKFLADPVWSGIAEKPGGGRKFDRSTDWMNSGVLKVGNWIAAAASGRDKIVRGLYNIPDLDAAIKQQSASKISSKSSSASRLKGGQNRIYYGAPGTGKSYSVEQQASNGAVFRTVFHPDMQNSDFFGTLKPVTSDAGKIIYAFSPGPFSKALAHAYANPSEAVWLIIEELNRAPAAAVFGDLFLLLDRDKDGTGEYDVDCPSEEAARWYKVNASIDDGKLSLPSNLWIVATMNSADQGVYPLDTAFRRRWRQYYISLDYSKGPQGNVDIAQRGTEVVTLNWLGFVERLNGYLAANADISEDRLVGPWFVKDSEFLEDGKLPGKLLIYLWDDLFRTHGRENVFDTKRLKTYGDISKAVEEGEQIFSDAVISVLTA